MAINLNQTVLVDNPAESLKQFSKLILDHRYSVKENTGYWWNKMYCADYLKLDFESVNKVYVHTYLSNGNIDTKIYATNDNWFGEYLFDTYYNKEVLGITTSTTANTTATLNTSSHTAWDGTYYTTGTPPYFTGSGMFSDCYETFEKDNDTMSNKALELNFGPCANTVRMSMYGLAVQNRNHEWVSYDADHGDIVNVNAFTIPNTGNLFYQLPIPISKIAIGNLLIHNDHMVYVTGFAEDTGNPVVIDIWEGTRVEILPTRSCFGFDYYTKVISLLDGVEGMNADPDHPFGKLLPFLLMKGGEASDILPFVMMNWCGSDNTQLFDNPMMMYFMMNNGKMNENLLPLLMMMNQK